MRFHLLVRPATPAETSEALERSPGAGPLAERGWRPVWVEATSSTEDDPQLERDAHVVWWDPADTAEAFVDEQARQLLADHVERSGDLAGVMDPEDVPEANREIESHIE